MKIWKNFYAEEKQLDGKIRFTLIASKLRSKKDKKRQKFVGGT